MSGYYPEDAGPSQAQQNGSTRAPRKRKKNSKTSAAKTAQEEAVVEGIQQQEDKIASSTVIAAAEFTPTMTNKATLHSVAVSKPTTAVATLKAADSDSDEGQGEGKKRKPKKRKRTRAKKVKDPDPNADHTLGEVAKSSLIYAHQYFYARETWKFAKARQAWLVRHSLSLPPVEASPKSTSTGTAVAGGLPSQAEQFEADQEEGPTFFPDAYVGIVGRYLATVQGAAKERFIATLKAALEAPVPPAPVATPASASGAEASTPGGEGEASTSFGALAMATDAATEASDTTTQDPVLIQRRRERARSLLSAMGEIK